MDRGIAIFLQVSAAIMLGTLGSVVVHHDTVAVLLLVGGVGFGSAGLILWGRAARLSVTAKQAPRTLDPPSTRLEEALIALQQDVAQLREDRDFYQRLYSGSTEKPPALRERAPLDRW